MKTKVIFKCQECGYSSGKWLGKCPDCGAWNSFVEEMEEKEVVNKKRGVSKSKVVNLSGAQVDNFKRLSTGIVEFDRILGGGMVPGSLILLGGAPGIGKSTLLLQLADKCKGKVFYVSGEESISQIKLRADRLGVQRDDVELLSTSSLQDIEYEINKRNPDILIIDSIQTICHEELNGIPGSIGQVREVTSNLLRIAKSTGTIVFVVGHVTKEGMLAGPKVLEHTVDTVLYFEDEKGVYRIIRSFKNRFGATSEIAVFEMTSIGLVEIDTPEKLFASHNDIQISGTVMTSVVEGTRPITIELQSLVSKTSYGMARRQVNGIDANRLAFLVAVIEKRLNINLATSDIFINLVGGMKIKEPSIDLATVVAILSSFYDVCIDKRTIFLGEVGLGGEIREISFLKERLNRAKNLGIQKAVVSYYTKDVDVQDLSGVEIVKLKHINEVLGIIK